MSSVTEGKWQLREEAWVDDGREVEVVSWEMLEQEVWHHLDQAVDDYRHALGCLRAGSRTGFRSWVQTGLQHKLAAHALLELLFEREFCMGLLPKAHSPSPRGHRRGQRWHRWGTFSLMRGD